MIHPDVLDDWYCSAKMMVEYEPEATLWDLFRFKLMWEHDEDIEKIIKGNNCIDCGKPIDSRAKKCRSCSKRGRNNPNWKGDL